MQQPARQGFHGGHPPSATWGAQLEPGKPGQPGWPGDRLAFADPAKAPARPSRFHAQMRSEVPLPPPKSWRGASGCREHRPHGRQAISGGGSRTPQAVRASKVGSRFPTAQNGLAFHPRIMAFWSRWAATPDSTTSLGVCTAMLGRQQIGRSGSSSKPEPSRAQRLSLLVVACRPEARAASITAQAIGTQNRGGGFLPICRYCGRHASRALSMLVAAGCWPQRVLGSGSGVHGRIARSDSASPNQARAVPHQAPKGGVRP